MAASVRRVCRKSPVIQIRRVTIIAFNPARKAANVDADSHEALSDFQLYAECVKQPLSKLDIDFKELHFRSFRLHLSGEDIVCRPKSDAVE